MFSDSDYRVPTFWQNWLFDTGSLTDRLLTVSNGNLSVKLVKQRLQQPRLSERQALKLGNRLQALVREVVLIGMGQPWVFARSIIPLSTLTGRLRKLKWLYNRPLGALLFNDSTMRREPVQVANFQLSTPILGNQFGTAIDPLWGRRSIFRLDKKPLLVSEIFLQPFQLYNEQSYPHS
mgnify:FL=1